MLDLVEDEEYGIPNPTMRLYHFYALGRLEDDEIRMVAPTIEKLIKLSTQIASNREWEIAKQSDVPSTWRRCYTDSEGEMQSYLFSMQNGIETMIDEYAD